MKLIHHVLTGRGRPPIVFVHGFACAHTDWHAQVAYFSPRHQTVAVDLRGHGDSPGEATECSVERYGADVAEVMRALALPPAILVGHSMGCRVVTEAALQTPNHTAAVVLVDGSQFSAEMEGVLKHSFAAPDGYATMREDMFPRMFTPKSSRELVAALLARSRRLPQPVGEKMMIDMQRYDAGRLRSSLASLRVPVMAVQTTYTNEKRERQGLGEGQITPYLELLRANIPSVRIEIIPGTGHFPQLDEPDQTNSLIESFARAQSATA